MTNDNKLIINWESLVVVCVVSMIAAGLCSWYQDEHDSAVKVLLLLHFFHVPLGMFLFGSLCRRPVYSKRYDTAVSCFIIYIITKSIIGFTRFLLGYDVSFSLLRESSIGSYALAAGIYITVSIWTIHLDSRKVMAAGIVLACIAGFDDQIGDFFALSQSIVYFPFFYAGLIADTEKIDKFRHNWWIKIAAVLILLVFGVSILKYGKQLIWLTPLISGRNPYSTLSKMGKYGWALRLVSYPVILALISAIILVNPRKKFTFISCIGKCALPVFVFSYPVIYLVLDYLELDSIIGKLSGIPFYLCLFILSILIVLLCARPSLKILLEKVVLIENWRDNKARFEKTVETKQANWKIKLPNSTQLILLFVVSIFLTFTVLFYGPLGLYLGNTEELPFFLNDVIKVTVPVFVISEAVLLLLGCVLQGKLREIYILVLFGLALGNYFQGTYLNIDYGVFDGSEIAWSNYSIYSLFNSIFWLSCFVIPFLINKYFKKYAEKIILYASAFFFVIQIPAMAVDLVHYSAPIINAKSKGISVSSDGIYELGKKENLIIILFDTMDEVYYQTYMEKHPDYADNLNGFVHYDNMLASGARTVMAMPSLMTGIPFTRSERYSDYIQSIWKSATPMAAMHEEGIDVRVFTESMFFGNAALGSVDNLTEEVEQIVSYGTLTKKLYQFDAFRFLPHRLKRHALMTTGSFNEVLETVGTYVEDDALFHQGLIDHGGFTVSNSYDKAFRLYLISGMHVPYTLTADGLGRNVYNPSKNNQLSGCFEILKTILDDLKEKNMYDSSTIIASADHGAYHLCTHEMFLYKPANATGPLSHTSVPASMFDLYNLLYDYAGQKAPENPYSRDLSSLNPTEERERHTFINTTDSASHVVVDEYSTIFHAKDYEAMVLENRYFGKGKNTPYHLGKTLSFKAEATGNRYAVEGFGNNTGFRTKLRGPYVRMEIPIVDLPEKGMLDITIWINKEINHETGVKFYANGIMAAEWSVMKTGKSQKFTFPIDIEETFSDGNNSLILELKMDDIPQEEMELPISKRTQTFSITYLRIDAAQE